MIAIKGLEFLINIYGFKNKDIADKLSISPVTVHDWIKGKRKIPLARLKQLSEIFNIPEEYLQKKLEDIDKMKIQKIKLDNELDSDISNKSFEEAGENNRDILRKVSIIDIKIKRSELLEELKEILEFENISDRIFINQNLTYLESVINIMKSSDFDKISMAHSISMLLLYYYEPDRYQEFIDTSGSYSDELAKLNDNFNKSILEGIKEFIETKKEIQF